MILFGFGIGIIVALLQSFGNFPVIQISFKIFNKVSKDPSGLRDSVMDGWMDDGSMDELTQGKN